VELEPERGKSDLSNPKIFDQRLERQLTRLSFVNLSKNRERLDPDSPVQPPDPAGSLRRAESKLANLPAFLQLT